MRISKLLSAVFAAAFLAGSLAVCAQDNPAQAAARAALMDKMNAQPSPPANQTMAPAIVITPSGVSAVQPSPPVVQTTATATSSETPLDPAGANDTPAQAAARAALMDKMNELNAQQTQPANPGLAPIVVAPAGIAAEPAGQPAKAKKTSSPPVAPKACQNSSLAACVSSSQNNSTARGRRASQETHTGDRISYRGQFEFFHARAAAVESGVQFNVQPAASGTPPLSYQWQSNPQPVTTPPPMAVAPPAKPVAPAIMPAPSPLPPPPMANYAGKSLGFAPMTAPPPPVTAQQQEELQALLGRYIANQISPEEYQKERAAILAGP